MTTLPTLSHEVLNPPDFLDVAKYPTMTYQSTGVRSVSGSEFVLDGELTIRGVTHPVELIAES